MHVLENYKAFFIWGRNYDHIKSDIQGDKKQGADYCTDLRSLDFRSNHWGLIQYRLLFSFYLLAFHCTCSQTVNDLVTEAAVYDNCGDDRDDDRCKHLHIVCVVRSDEF